MRWLIIMPEHAVVSTSAAQDSGWKRAEPEALTCAEPEAVSTSAAQDSGWKPGSTEHRPLDTEADVSTSAAQDSGWKHLSLPLPSLGKREVVSTSAAQDSGWKHVGLLAAMGPLAGGLESRLPPRRIADGNCLLPISRQGIQSRHKSRLPPRRIADGNALETRLSPNPNIDRSACLDFRRAG